jgi:uncharacterized ubiquitin-like protein YukD
MDMVEHITLDDINSVDGILYSDIKDILDSKEVLENVLFTTKIMFLDNKELIEFMNKLTMFGYDDIALDYVENLYDKVMVDFTKFKYDNKSK